MTLLEQTLYLLKNRARDLTYEKLAELADLDDRWIGAFAQSKMADPSCRKVEKLYAALNGSPLEF